MHKFKKYIGLIIVLMLALTIGAGMLPSFAGTEPENEPSHEAPAEADVPRGANEGHEGQEDSDWSVGELRDNGLRIIPSGRADASAVLDPAQFESAEIREGYQIAREIPHVLNQLYCWCQCAERGQHRSNLACFEDLMGTGCEVCQETAKIASEMVAQGVTDAGQIQAKVDAIWGHKG